MSSIAAVLSSRTVLEGPRRPTNANHTIVSCEDHESLRNAMEKLIKNDILAMPVYSHSTGECIGLVGLLEIVKHVTDLHWTHIQEPKMNREAAIYVALGNTTVSSVVSKRQLKVGVNATFFGVAQALVSMEGVRRVAVIEEGSGRVVHIVSETEIVGLLYEMGGKLEEGVMKKRVKNLSVIERNMSGVDDEDSLFKRVPSQRHLGFKVDSKVDLYEQYGVMAVNKVAKAIEAFRVMVSMGATAVPIVDDEYVVVGSVSVSDIRRMSVEGMGVLYEEECGEFGRGVEGGSLFVGMEDEVQSVLERMSENRMHRVWVVDGKKRLVGVVSLRDVLKEFL